MPDDNSYDLASLVLAPDEPTFQERAKALSDALRGQRSKAEQYSQLGLLGSLTGDSVLGNFGHAALGYGQQQRQLAQHGDEKLLQVPDIRARADLHAAQAKKAAQEEADLNDPASRAALLASVKDLNPGLAANPDVANAPARILSRNVLPSTEKAALSRQPKFAVNNTTGGLYNTKTGLPAEGAGGNQPNNVTAIADAIVSGDQPPELKGMYKLTAAVRGELARRGFNLATAQNDWQATQKHIATLNGSQQTRLRQAVDSTSEQINNIEQLYGEWQRTGLSTRFKAFNRAALGAAKQFGGDAGALAQGLEGQIALLTGELGNVLMGGNSPTDHGLKLAGQMLSGDWNEQSFQKALSLLRRDLQIRQNSLKHSAAAGTSASNMYGPKPEPGVQTPPPPAPSPADQQALAWAKANATDPRAKKILEANGIKP